MQKSRVSWWLGGFCIALMAGLAWHFKPAQAPAVEIARKLQCDLPSPDAHAPQPGMVWVPPGKFDMGDNVYAEEKLVRNVQVKGFWMDRTEVTNQEFAAFVKATGYVTVAERPIDPKLHAGLPEVMRQAGAVVFKMPSQLTRGDDPSQWWQYVPGANWQHPAGPSSTIDKHGHFPVVHITYEDALAYAKWKGRSLPTEAQWEWAARAGASALPHQHDQPASANTWQGIFPMANSAEDGFAGLAPVGCYGANAWGLFDMIGNVWELTSDVFVADRTAPAIGQGQGLDPDAAQKPPDFKAGKVQARVIKGGSFLCAPNYCMRYRAGSRQAQEEDLAVSHLGFRTVLQP
jgi:formylglycine-generating enzyme required for sulfatase activity